MIVTMDDVSLEVEGKTLEGWISLSSVDSGPSGELTKEKRSLQELLLPERSFIFCRQVHSLRVLFIDRDREELQIVAYRGHWSRDQLEIEREGTTPDRVNQSEITGFIGEADGIVSRVRSMVPGVTVADCIPIHLHQKTKKPSTVLSSPIYGTLHSGWQGTGISLVALRGIEELWGLGADEFEIGFGPGICGDCYVVDSQRADIVRTRFGSDWIREVPGTGKWIGQKQYTVDLYGINRELAFKRGIGLIESEIHCTKEQDKYWSYRRGQNSRRMFAFTLGKDSR